MLYSLRVENLALIEKEEIEFTEGLNVLTGETGAGKSIILGALSLALGGKIDKGMVRDTGRDAYVEAIFSLDETEEKRLREADFEPEDGQLIFSRKIKEGKSQARLNGETVPAARLKKAGDLLLDIYGQNEHQSLSDPKKHLRLLDEFVKKDLDPVLEELAPVYKEYISIKKSIEEADIDEAQQKRDISYYSHVSEEIEEADLKPGEDEELEGTYKKMAGSEKVAKNLSEVQNLLFEGEDVLSRIGESQRSLASIADYDESVEDLGKTLSDAYGILENFSHELVSTAENLTFDPAEFDQVTRRLDLINDLKQKYGRTIEDIYKSKEEADEKLEQLNDHENYVAGLKKKLEDTSKTLNKLCEKAEDIRKNGAEALSEKVKESLKNLNFLKADFEVELTRTS